MHYKHSNGEVGTIDETTGKRSVWKVCDICGAQQRSNNGKRGSCKRKSGIRFIEILQPSLAFKIPYPIYLIK